MPDGATAPEAAKRNEDAGLAWAPARILRWIGLALCGFLYLVMLSWGGPEFLLAATVAVLLGWMNPLWGICGIVLFGPLFLNPSSAHGMMPVVDALALGAVAGMIRRAGSAPETSSGGRACFGAWPVLVLGMLLLVLAASWPPLVLLWFEDSHVGPEKWIRHVSHAALAGGETGVAWGLRSLVHWMLGLGLAVAAARHATRHHIVLLLKMGAAGLVVACVLGLIDEVARRVAPGFFSLEAIRRINPDPQQAGRFQGTAGHAGWLGEWMLLWGGGLLLFLRSPSRGVRRVAVLSLALVTLCLVLTAARAAWFGAFVAGGIVVLLAGRSLRPSPRVLVVGGMAVIVVGVLALLLGGEAVTGRVDRLLRFSDRANYFSSGWVMVREFPLGIGLGLHHVQYAAWFTDRFHYYQMDHVTSHNQYLHLLIEQGPPMLLAFLGGCLALLVAGLRAWHADRGTESLVPAVLVGALVAMMINGLAQYFLYIRAVEYGFWILCGLMVGHAVRTVPPGRMGATVARGLVLALCGIGAVSVLRAHGGRELIGERPRPWVYTCTDEGCFWTKWTPRRERFPVEPTANGLHFSLFRLHTPANVVLTWPDGHRDELRLDAGEFRWFFRNFGHVTTINENQDPIYFDARRWMTIEVDNLHVPALWEGQSLDQRGLGVFVNHLWQFYYWEPRPEGYSFAAD